MSQLLKSQKGLAPIIIILSVVIFLLVGGILVWQYWEKPTVPLTREGQIIVKQSGVGAALLTSECADKSYITKEADYIIEGVVEKRESKLFEFPEGAHPIYSGKVIFTYTDLAIKNYVKGTPFKENKLQIITPFSGCVEEFCQTAEDQPIFHEGKRVRIYLRETNGEFSIVCMQMGVEEINSQ